MTTLDLLSSLTYDANCARGSLMQCSEQVLDILKRLQNLDDSRFDEEQKEAIYKAIDGCKRTLGNILVCDREMKGISDPLWDFPWKENLR